MRLKGLDILRAFAVLLVMFRHMNPWPENEIPVLSTFMKAMMTGGWIGVDLFFVLSGFLVSGLIFTEYQKYQEFDVKRFFIRRGFKIYPSFYFFLLLVLVLKIPTETPVNQYSTLAEVFYLQNYNLGWWSHTWTLAIEEHFYIILATLLFFSSKRKQEQDPFSYVPVLCLSLSLALLVLRIQTAYQYTFDFRRHLFPTHLRIDSLFFGTFLSYLYHYKRDQLEIFVRKHKRDLRALPFICLLPAFVYPLGTTKYIHTFGFTFFYLGFGCILLLVIFNTKIETNASVFARAFAKIGMYSYSIYLWHMPVKRLMALIFKGLLVFPYSYIIEFLVYMFLSLFLGICMAKFIETPFLAIRNRRYPSLS